MADDKDVIDLRAKRAEKAGKKKLELAERQRALALAINRNELISTLPTFPRQFYCIEPAPGVKEVLEEKDGIVEFSSIEAVRSAIVCYTSEVLRASTPRPVGYAWTSNQAMSAANFWLDYTKPIDMPPAARWVDEPGLTFNRLPWKYEPDTVGDKKPLFEELLSRTSNAIALAEWIGSLFVEGSERQQYVWLYGGGSNGKGALARFLAKVFGHTYRSMQPPGQNDTHWTYGLLGARLVVFPDCNNAGYPASGHFKSLTGDDPVSINPKFQKAYTTNLNCKFMFLSNEKPTLSSETADMRRAIYCEMAPLPEGTAIGGDYEARLWAEGGAFLSTCIDLYKYSYPKHGPIRTDIEHLEELVSANEERFEVFFERHFIVARGKEVTAHEMEQITKDEFRSTREQGDFSKWMVRKRGVVRTRIKKPGDQYRTYQGIKTKPLAMGTGRGQAGDSWGDR